MVSTPKPPPTTMEKEVYLLTLDAVTQGRDDTPAYKGIKNIDDDAGYRTAAAMSHGDRAIADSKRPFVVRACGIDRSNNKVYLELGCPKILRVQFPKTCSSDRHIVGALRLLERTKKLPNGYFSERLGTERVKKVMMPYGVGYIPDALGKPLLHTTLELRIPFEGMYRVARSFFRYTTIPGGPNGPYTTVVHQGSGSVVRQFTNETGAGTAKWCVFGGVRPFKAIGVSTASFEGIANTAKEHPDPPPPPDISFQAFDIECVGQSKAEWDANPDCSKIPDPNHSGAECRQISSHVFYTRSRREENRVYEIRSPFYDITDVELRGDAYLVVPFDSELDMILSFLDYSRGFDIRTGYNNNLFDWPYLIVRAHLLAAGRSITRALVMGSLPADRYTSFYSAARREEVSVVKESQARRAVYPVGTGTLFFDTLDLLKSGKFGGFKSFKLRNVATKILKGDAGKDPLDHRDIAHCLHGTMTAERYAELCGEVGIDPPPARTLPTYAEMYSLVRHYCLLDSKVLRLMFERRSMWETLCSTSAIIGVPLQVVCDKKSKELVTHEHEKLCHTRGILLNERERLNRMAATEDGKAFEGGAVLDATVGLHACAPDTEPESGVLELLDKYRPLVERLVQITGVATAMFFLTDALEPLVTLDLMSMYPSIMRRWNLSPDTVRIPDAKLYPCERYDAACAKRRGVVWDGEAEHIPDVDPSVLRELGPGYWADSPRRDRYNAFVIPSPKPGTLPRLIYVVKPQFYEGVYVTMVGRAFDGRRDRKKLMKALNKVADIALELAGSSEAVPDHRELVAEVDAMRKANDIRVEDLPAITGFVMAQVAGAAKAGAIQADSEQSVLKILNNAMYGANGFVPNAQPGKEPKPPKPTECLEVAAIVTAVGRQMNKEMENRFCDHTIPEGTDALTEALKTLYGVVGVWRAIGDTDSVIVKYGILNDLIEKVDVLLRENVALRDFVKDIPLLDKMEVPQLAGLGLMERAFTLAEIMAKDCTDVVWGGDKIRVLEVDGVTPYSYVHGKKLRCELLYEKLNGNPKRKISGMCPTKVNDPFVKRDVIQAFCDLVLDCGAMRITGWRLLLIYTLWQRFERLLLRPEEGGYDIADYSTSTLIGQLNNLKTPHLVALGKRCKRQGVPLSFYSGQYMPWVTIKGDAKATLRTEDTDTARWDHIDRLYAFTNTVAPIVKKTVVDKPWVRDGTPILPTCVWASIYDTYRALLSKQGDSSLTKVFKPMQSESTPPERLNNFVKLFLGVTHTPRASHAKRRSTRDITSFFPKPKKTKA